MFLEKVGQTKQFLQKNDDIFVINSDKCNKAVVMNKADYKRKMKEILWNICTYRRLRKYPTSSLKTKNNLLVYMLFNLKLIDAREEQAMLTTRTTADPRIYGLPKIHKHSSKL